MSMYMMMRRMSQDPEIAQHQLSPGVVWRVLRFAKPYRLLITVFVVLVVVMSALSVTPPLLFKQIIDNGILQGNQRVVIILSVTVAVCCVLQAVLNLVQRWFSSRIGEGLIFDMRTQVFDHVIQMPVAFFTRTQTGKLVSRLNSDVIGAQQAFTSTLSTVLVQLDRSGAGAGSHDRAELAAHPCCADHVADLPHSGQDRRPQARRPDASADATQRRHVGDHDRAVQRQRGVAGQALRPVSRRARPVRGTRRSRTRCLGQDRHEWAVLVYVAGTGRGVGHGAGVRRGWVVGHRRRTHHRYLDGLGRAAHSAVRAAHPAHQSPHRRHECPGQLRSSLRSARPRAHDPRRRGCRDRQGAGVGEL